MTLDIIFHVLCLILAGYLLLTDEAEHLKD